MLTDERIREVLGLVGMDDNDEVGSLSVIETIAEARAIEQEVTKSQEPVTNAISALETIQYVAQNLIREDGMKSIFDFAAYAISRLSETTPQTCPSCQKWENKYLMEQAVNAGDGVLISENERLQAKCAEIEAERDHLAEIIALPEMAQFARIKELEAERDALKNDLSSLDGIKQIAVRDALLLRAERDALKKQIAVKDEKFNQLCKDIDRLQAKPSPERVSALQLADTDFEFWGVPCPE